MLRNVRIGHKNLKRSLTRIGHGGGDAKPLDTPEIGAVYAKACRKFVDKRSRQTSIPDTELRRLADASPASKRDTGTQCSGGMRSHGTKVFLLHSDDTCVDMSTQEHRSSPLQPACRVMNRPRARRNLEPKDQLTSFIRS